MSVLWSILSSVSWWQYLAVLALLSFLLYRWLTANYGQFEALGVPANKPALFFGNDGDLYSGTKGFAEHYADVYKTNSEHRYKEDKVAAILMLCSKT